MSHVSRGSEQMANAAAHTGIVTWCVLIVVAMCVAGCTATRAGRNAEYAMSHGDPDSAVGYYRQALAAAPERIEYRIGLERATRMAASEHIKRARELEAQDQLT